MTRLTTDQLIEFFVDRNTWVPVMKDTTSGDDHGDRNLKGDGVACGMGSIRGRKVCMFIQDLDVLFGTIGKLHGKKVRAIISMAIENKCPLIGIIQTGGARIQEGPVGLGAASYMASKLIEASGYIPTISIVNGPGAGGGAYMTALSDFCIMNEQDAYMFLTGPKVIKRVLNEEIDEAGLGGIDVHFRKTGLASFRAKHVSDSKNILTDLLSYLPSWYNEARTEKPILKGNLDRRPALNKALPSAPEQPYDIEVILKDIFDDNSILEYCAGFAANAVTAFARLGGMSIGVVANQPACMGGVLDVDATRKIGRFVQICDAYNIPLVFVLDCPGYLPGKDQEWQNLIGKGAFMAHLICSATVPKVTMIVRKAIGGAYATLNSKDIGGDHTFAWVHAEISVVGIEAAMDVLVKKYENNEEVIEEEKRKFREKYLNPYLAASTGLIDKVIEPSESRIQLLKVFRSLYTKKAAPEIQKKHGILPLT